MPIDLWAVRLERSLTENEMAAMMRLLPRERRERLLRLRPEEKKREPLCAYLMLCMALRYRYQWKELPEILLTEKGKPYFPEHPDVHFNISHTGGAALVGVSDQPIGVDIEKVRPVSERSMRRLAAASTAEEFFQSWVRREARAKRSGDGVSTMMRSESPLQYGEFYYELETFPGYVAGVATRSKEHPGAVRKYSLEEMI